MKKAPKTKRSAQPDLIIRIVCSGKMQLGPGRIELLELLDRTGSISEAARQMRLSYMKAWQLTRNLKTLIAVSRGGSHGGGVSVTDEGREAIRLYRRMETNSRKACGPSWKKLQALLK